MEEECCLFGAAGKNEDDLPLSLSGIPLLGNKKTMLIIFHLSKQAFHHWCCSWLLYWCQVAQVMDEAPTVIPDPQRNLSA